jgi:transcriptional/translational regulatory protein YebC/TACO1
LNHNPIHRLSTSIAAPLNHHPIQYERCEALYDRLMELDDVDAVYTNADGLA